MSRNKKAKKQAVQTQQNRIHRSVNYITPCTYINFFYPGQHSILFTCNLTENFQTVSNEFIYTDTMYIKSICNLIIT